MEEKGNNQKGLKKYKKATKEQKKNKLKVKRKRRIYYDIQIKRLLIKVLSRKGK